MSLHRLRRLWELALLLCLSCLVPQSLVAQNYLPTTLSEDAIVSIIVAEPSAEAVYTLYGHAGMRVRDRGLDVVFNYGLFDFDEGFLWRFIQGRTDYFVGVEETNRFVREYLDRGSRVREYELSLTPDVYPELWRCLLANLSAEQRTYRYNFFHDNCATRPLELLFASIEASPTMLLEPKVKPDVSTWRREINQLEQAYPWLVLGTDLALGAPTDRAISSREATFLPHNIHTFLIEQRWRAVGDTLGDQPSELVYVRELDAYDYPLPEDDYVLSADEGDIEVGPMDSGIDPVLVFALLLGLVSVAMFLGGRLGTVVTYTLLVVAGLAGCLLGYIALVSEHPSVWPNYNLLVLHPVHLLVPLLALCGARRWVDRLHFVNFVVQALFLLGSYFLPQSFNLCVYLISATLLTLSVGHALERIRQRDARR